MAIYIVKDWDPDQPRDADGRWGSGGSDGEGTAALDERTAAAVDTWTSLGGSHLVNEEQTALISKAIDEHGTPSPGPLVRGVSVTDEQYDEILSGLHPGDSLSIGPTSYTTDYETALAYGEQSDRAVIIHLPDGTQSLDVAAEAASHGYIEHERIAQGEYKALHAWQEPGPYSSGPLSHQILHIEYGPGQ
jgi:hypothetical protein